jgi:integrase
LQALIDDWWKLNFDHWQGQTAGTFASGLKHIPEEWLTAPFSAITISAADHAHVDIKGKYAADMFKRVLHMVYNHAVKRGWSTFNPFGAVRAHGGKHREVSLEQKQLQGLDAAIAALDEPDRSYFRLVRLIGPRKLELLKAKWSDFDPVKGTLTFPTRKNMKSHPLHVVPLGTEALGIVKGLKSRGRSGFLFPNSANDDPLTRRDAIWAKVIKAAGLRKLPVIGNLRQHDLRHLLISGMLEAGVPIQVVADYVGDSVITIMKVYRRLTTIEGKLTAARMFEAALNGSAPASALTETKAIETTAGKPEEEDDGAACV